MYNLYGKQHTCIHVFYANGETGHYLCNTIYFVFIFSDTIPLTDSLAEPSSDYGEEVLVESPQRQFIHHAATLTDTFLPSSADHSIELQGGSQTFFPSFASIFQQQQQQQRQPLGHSRPLSYNQEGAYSQRPNALRQLLNYQGPSFTSFRSNNDYVKSTTQASDTSGSGSSSTGILGSGNFNVIRGGTFLAENSDTESQFSDSFESPYYNNNNGHGRPSYFFNGGNPRPSYNQDQFANFRDFADINSPSNSPAYSHFVVVFANRNATIDDVEKTNSDLIKKLKSKEEPKNIIERLAQIDREKQNDSMKDEESEISPPKLSKNKQKLSLLKDKKSSKTYKKFVSKSPSTKDLTDPLIALS